MKHLKALEAELAVRGNLGHATEVAKAAQTKGTYLPQEAPVSEGGPALWIRN